MGECMERDAELQVQHTGMRSEAADGPEADYDTHGSDMEVDSVGVEVQSFEAHSLDGDERDSRRGSGFCGAGLWRPRICGAGFWGRRRSAGFLQDFAVEGPGASI